jgi:hypothetical protein
MEEVVDEYIERVFRGLSAATINEPTGTSPSPGSVR